MKQAPKCIIFDWDGTLVGCEQLVHAAYVLTLDKLGDKKASAWTPEDTHAQNGKARAEIFSNTAIWGEKGNDSSIMFAYGKVKQDVSFTVDGKVVKTYQAANGSVVELPDAPVRDGFVFAGWYGLNGDEITAEILVNGDIQAVAAFVPETVVISVDEVDGMTVVTSDVFYLDHADIEDAYLLAIVEYEDKVIWTYQKIVWNGDTSSGRISVTTDGLKKVSVTLVDGDSPRDIESFGTDFVTF